MLDLVAHDCLKNAGRILFILEFGRMDADHHNLIGILLFQLLQVRNDVHAVDAAVRPEIEQYDFASQVLEPDRRVGIDPIQSGRKLRRIGFSGISRQ